MHHLVPILSSTKGDRDQMAPNYNQVGGGNASIKLLIEYIGGHKFSILGEYRHKFLLDHTCVGITNNRQYMKILEL